MLFRSLRPSERVREQQGGRPLRLHRLLAQSGLHGLLGRRAEDRKSTRLNSSHTEIYTLSLHDALPISPAERARARAARRPPAAAPSAPCPKRPSRPAGTSCRRSEEHTSELQSHRDLHSFPTRCSSDLSGRASACASSKAAARCGSIGSLPKAAFTACWDVVP